MTEQLENLKSIAAALKRNELKREQLIADRDVAILEARAAEHTWRSIALTLGMTEHGVAKAIRTRAQKAE